jgi:hypothetical protein
VPKLAYYYSDDRLGRRWKMTRLPAADASGQGNDRVVFCDARPRLTLLTEQTMMTPSRAGSRHGKATQMEGPIGKFRSILPAADARW